MNISQPRTLLAAADEALEVGREPKKVVLYYAGILTLLSVLTSLLGYLVDGQLAQAGGLGKLELNAVLSTVQTLLPWVAVLVQMCLSMGYLMAMLRIGRKLYADQSHLKEGLRRFGPVLRFYLLEYLLYFVMGFVVMQPLSVIFVMTPLGRPLMELMQTSGPMDAAMEMAMLQAMAPMLVIFGLVMVGLMIPVSYYLRMTRHLIADHPGMGAIAAVLGSFRMMRGNCLKLFRLDLQLWWYYVLSLVPTLLSLAPMALTMLGIPLPLGQTGGMYLLQGLSLAASFALMYFAGNKVELTYVMAYEALRPRESKQEVVLGSIFQQ